MGLQLLPRFGRVSEVVADIRQPLEDKEKFVIDYRDNLNRQGIPAVSFDCGTSETQPSLPGSSGARADLFHHHYVIEGKEDVARLKAYLQTHIDQILGTEKSSSEAWRRLREDMSGPFKRLFRPRLSVKEFQEKLDQVFHRAHVDTLVRRMATQFVKDHEPVATLSTFIPKQDEYILRTIPKIRALQGVQPPDTP